MNKENTFTKVLKYKIPLWTLLITLSIAFISYFIGIKKQKDAYQSRINTTVNYLEETQEVVFLNAGLDKIISSGNHSVLPFTNIKIPFSEKKTLIILSYEAKLGIKKPVDIKMKENTVDINVPKFEVIGVSLNKDEPYKIYDESSGIFSFSTDDIDTATEVTKQLSNKEQAEFLIQYKDIMKNSAKKYYESIFKPINPEIEVNVNFVD